MRAHTHKHAYHVSYDAYSFLLIFSNFFSLLFKVGLVYLVLGLALSFELLVLPSLLPLLHLLVLALLLLFHLFLPPVLHKGPLFS